MNRSPKLFQWACLVAVAGTAVSPAQSIKPAVQAPSVVKQDAKANAVQPSSALVQSGNALYQENCAFCHGRDAGGGETGPDLTRSKLVGDDKAGDKIGPVVLNGRVEKGMPKFSLSSEQISQLTAFIHKQKSDADLHQGGRRGVDAADLQTGNVAAGKLYFKGAGGCTGCHSESGDLAHVATRFEGLKLEQRLLYPRDAPAKLTVTLPNGETISGALEYRDEFTLGLLDQTGWYRAWPASKVKFTINDPAQAHADLLAKYTDDDIHNLMAYLQTLR